MENYPRAWPDFLPFWPHPAAPPVWFMAPFCVGECRQSESAKSYNCHDTNLSWFHPTFSSGWKLEMTKPDATGHKQGRLGVSVLAMQLGWSLDPCLLAFLIVCTKELASQDCPRLLDIQTPPEILCVLGMFLETSSHTKPQWKGERVRNHFRKDRVVKKRHPWSFARPIGPIDPVQEVLFMNGSRGRVIFIRKVYSPEN